MTKKQEKHLQEIIEEFCKLYKKKYSKGTKEHGGNLWLKEGIIDMAIEEVIDLFGYLYTLKRQIKGIKLGSVKEK